MNNPEIKKLTEHQPDIIEIKSVNLIDTKEIKNIECSKLKSKKTYKIAINFDTEEKSSFEPIIYIDSLSGENCYNPEAKILPDRCDFGKEIYCVDFDATTTTTNIILQGAKELRNVKFKSNYCKNEITMDLNTQQPTKIKFNDCNNYINHITQFQDDISYEYNDPTSEEMVSSLGLIRVSLK
tara:strand:+ start:2215 stop:2760 length:546 start_codon:yes stop_codon:yes gene_type:complete